MTRRRRLARAAVIVLGIAPLGAIAVAFVVAMNAGPCRRNCHTDIYVEIPFVLRDHEHPTSLSSAVGRYVRA